MSTTMSDEPGRTGTEAVGSLPGRKRFTLIVLGLAFWTWITARWIHDKILAPDVILRHRDPFLSPAPFEAFAASIGAQAPTFGPAGFLVSWLAWGVELIALSIESAPMLADGAWVTIQLTVGAIALGFVVALPLAVVRVYGGRISRSIALVYTELLRGTPLLAQLFIVWFGLNLGPKVEPLPGVGGPLPDEAVIVAILAFAINSSAYQTEYIRSALESVDPGQYTAARAVGLGKLAAIRYVVVPQGMRLAIPSWTNEFIYLIKYTSLASFIAVPELFRQARNIGAETYQFTNIYVVVTVFYIALVLTATAVMNRVEDRTSIPGLGT